MGDYVGRVAGTKYTAARKAEVQKQVKARIINPYKEKANQSTCAHVVQRPLNMYGGETIFKAYNKIRDTWLGRYLDDNNLEPAHEMIELSNGDRFGYGPGGHRFEESSELSYTDGKCINEAKLMDELPKIIETGKDYHGAFNNCQDEADNMALSAK